MLEISGATKNLSSNGSCAAVFHILAKEGLGRWMWNVPSGEVFWSPEVHDIFSIASFDNRIESFQKRVHPDDFEKMVRNSQDSIRDAGDVRGCFRIRSDDGSYRDVFNAGRIIQDKRGRPLKFVGIVRACYPHEIGERVAQKDSPIAQPNGITHDHEHIKALLATAIASMDAGDLRRAEVAYLQFILMRTNNRDDAFELSNRLMKRFGGLAAVVNADSRDLLMVDGIRQEHLALFEIIQLGSRAMLKPRNRPWSFQTLDQLTFYLRSVQAYNQTEEFRVLFLDSADHITHDEVLSEGTSSFVPVNIKDVIKRAIDLGSKGIVLVHNHPSGKSTPSLADIEMTQKLVAAARVFDIKVVDHIVLSRFDHSSFRSLGLID